MNKYEHPTDTLIITSHNPTGIENSYVQFGYDPQIIFSHTRGQVLVSKTLIWSIKTDKSTINDVLTKRKTPKETKRNNLINVDWEVLFPFNRYLNKKGLIKNNQTMNELIVWSINDKKVCYNVDRSVNIPSIENIFVCQFLDDSKGVDINGAE